MTKELTQRPYVGKDQLEIQSDDAPIQTKNGWSFVREPKEEKTEEQKKYEALEATPDDKLTQEERTWKKRYGDLRGHSQTKENELKKELDGLKKQLEQATSLSRAPAMSDEDIENIRAEHPDSVAAIEAIARKEAEVAEKRLKELEDKLASKELEALKEKALRVIERKHPDWQEVVYSDEFQAWAETQPEQIKSWVFDNETDGELAAKAITYYKLEKGEKPNKSNKKDKVDASRSTHVGGGTEVNHGKRIYTRQEIQNMTLSEYEKLSTDIKLARSEGRIK